jgi:divalent metal cation (Fe/Co/Zn/Cd) transporter
MSHEPSDRGRSNDHSQATGGHEHDHGNDLLVSLAGTASAHSHDRGHGHPSGIRGWLHEAFVPHTHDAANSVDDALEASDAGVRAVKLSLVGLGATAALQLAVVGVSGSVALLADTVHNFSDALTAVPLWVAFALGRRAASRRYTFGYGRVEDLAGLFIVAMIGVSAVVAGVQSVRRLLDPQPVTHLGWVLAAGLIGFVGNELVAVYRIRMGRRIGSAALVADGVHARTDGFTSLAVVLGVIGGRLLDGVDPALVDQSEDVLAGLPGVVAVPGLQVRWIGHRLSVYGTVQTDPSMTLKQFHALEHRADHAIRDMVPRVGTVRLHAAVRPKTTEQE